MKRWLLLLPVALIVLAATALLALPAYLASAANRPTVEALASRITGRQVRIAGPLAVTLLPSPDIAAADVTITGPSGEKITAATLTLNLSGTALAHGRLAARDLTLIDPVIALPWPLPGGAAEVSPPGWLATLHAAVVNGRLSLGALTVSRVNANIYTDHGAVTLTGSGQFAGHPTHVNLALARQGADGMAPLSLAASAGRLTLHLTGALSAASTLDGELTFNAGNIAGAGAVTADGQAISSAGLSLRDGTSTLTGTATMSFAPPHLSAALSGDGLDITAPQAPAGWPIPSTLSLAVTHARFFGREVPAAQLTLDFAPDGSLRLDPLLLYLPGEGVLTASIARAPSGTLSGQARLTATDVTALLAAYSLPPVPDWTRANLSTNLGGTSGALALQNLRGTLGHERVTGTIVITPGHADGVLAFSHLDLLALRPWLGRRGAGIEADGEITAATASLGPLSLTNMLIDGAAGHNLDIRRFSADAAHGLLAGSLALRDGLAQGSLQVDLPSAAGLAPLVAALTGLIPPPALLAPRLALNAVALGAPAALSLSAVAALGDFTLTAAPVIDLNDGTGGGALTLRHPNAIRALSIFNLNRGLDWPGAGSLSLRANAVDTGKIQGLTDFILSLGRLQASGRLVRQNGAMNGAIIASDLDLPRWPPRTPIPWGALSALTGKLTLRADTLSVDRQALLSPLAATFAATPGRLNLALNPSGLAGGTVQGTAAAFTATGAAPSLTAAVTLNDINAAQLPQPTRAPLGLTAGTLAGLAHLAATGYSPATWEDTLGGTLSLSVANGSLAGRSLANLATALATTGPNTRARQIALTTALTTGTTDFTAAGLTASLADGTATLTDASLTSPQGALTATGTADLPDNLISIRLTTTPTRGPTLTTTLTGPWPIPHTTQTLAPALGWVGAVSK